MSRLGSALLCGAFCLSACGEGGDTGGTGMPTVADPNGDTGGECVEGSLQGCNCTSGLAGTQTCTGNAWGQCVCNVVTSQSDGSVLPPLERLCKAGYYTGTFEGQYWSGVFDFGFGSLLPVPVVAQATGTNPGLGLTLEAKEMAIGEEFSTYAVQDGCVIGNADAFGLSNPFVGVLTGELDCDTGRFEGSLKGYYNLLTTGITYPFEGPVSAQYMNEELRDGMWDVKEHMMSDNAPGGSGSWSVKWVGGVEDAPPLPEECLQIIDGTPTEMGGDTGVAPPAAGGDAGVATPTDAGTAPPPADEGVDVPGDAGSVADAGAAEADPTSTQAP